jgi:hypothetical protein
MYRTVYLFLYITFFLSLYLSLYFFILHFLSLSISANRSLYVYLSHRTEELERQLESLEGVKDVQQRTSDEAQSLKDDQIEALKRENEQVFPHTLGPAS